MVTQITEVFANLRRDNSFYSRNNINFNFVKIFRDRIIITFLLKVFFNKEGI